MSSQIAELAAPVEEARMACTLCNGDGYLDTSWEDTITCPRCGGEKYIPSTEQLVAMAEAEEGEAMDDVMADETVGAAYESIETNLWLAEGYFARYRNSLPNRRRNMPSRDAALQAIR